MSDQRDREVVTAWREANREEPSPALDAAIRAEARRAVSAAPGGRRRRQWRYPAAAAATVAVLAFGIAQMTSRERIEPVIVADQVAPPPKTLPAPASPPQTVEPAKPAETTGDAKVAAVPAPATQPSSPAPSKQTLRKEAGAAPFAAAPATPLPSDAPSAAAPSGRVGDVRADAVTGNPPQAEPFPSAAQQKAAAETPADEAAKSGEASEQAPRRQTNTSRDAYPQAPAPALGVSSSKVEREQAGAASTTVVTSADELKAQQAGAESVAAWIARIRALKDGGQLDAAVRELARFRSAFGDRADALLPPDLRRVTPSDAKGQ
jgi:hypothetical protein